MNNVKEIVAIYTIGLFLRWVQIILARLFEDPVCRKQVDDAYFASLVFLWPLWFLLWIKQFIVRVYHHTLNEVKRFK